MGIKHTQTHTQRMVKSHHMWRTII